MRCQPRAEVEGDELDVTALINPACKGDELGAEVMGLTENHAVENALATIGAVLWSIQIIPQLVLSYRTKSTKGLSENLML